MGLRETIKPRMQAHSDDAAFDHDETLDIASCKIGKVFGTKSKQIKRIRKQSGARIDVDNKCEPCRVRIRGDESSVAMAKDMILTLTLETMDSDSEYIFFPREAAGAILGPRGT